MLRNGTVSRVVIREGENELAAVGEASVDTRTVTLPVLTLSLASPFDPAELEPPLSRLSLLVRFCAR